MPAIVWYCKEESGKARWAGCIGGRAMRSTEAWTPIELLTRETLLPRDQNSEAGALASSPHAPARPPPLQPPHIVSWPTPGRARSRATIATRRGSTDG